MELAHIPEMVITRVLAQTPVDLQQFDEPERLAVEHAILWIRQEDLNDFAILVRRCAGYMILIMISIVVGLAGWGLSAKHMILHCTNCSAAMAPS